jgi:hypothetical protein
MAKDREERYASTRDLARDLVGLRDHLSEATSGGETLLASPARPRSRTKWIAAALGAASSGTCGPRRGSFQRDSAAPTFEAELSAASIGGARFAPSSEVARRTNRGPARAPPDAARGVQSAPSFRETSSPSRRTVISRSGRSGPAPRGHSPWFPWPGARPVRSSRTSPGGARTGTRRPAPSSPSCAGPAAYFVSSSRSARCWSSSAMPRAPDGRDRVLEGRGGSASSPWSTAAREPGRSSAEHGGGMLVERRWPRTIWLPISGNGVCLGFAPGRLRQLVRVP